MKKIIRKIAAMVTAISTLMCSMSVINVNAASTASKSVGTNITLNGAVSYQTYNPYGGVYGYYVTALTYLTGSYTHSSPWYLITAIDLDNYVTGALISHASETGANYENYIDASIVGNTCLGVQAKAFASHEVRGAYSGGVYTSTNSFSI